MKVKSESEVAQLSPTVSDPMDCSLSGSSFHGILQERVMESIAIAFSKLKSRGYKNYNEVSPHTGQNGHYQKKKIYKQ